MLIELLFLQVSEIASSHTQPNGWTPIIADRQLSHSMQTTTSPPRGLKFEPTYNHLQGSRASMIHLKKTQPTTQLRIGSKKELQYILTQETTTHTNQQTSTYRREIIFLTDNSNNFFVQKGATQFFNPG
jgi:hypothetical protein